ncbi:MAG: NAD-dependent epimerase/dehydratase family protein [Chitinophagales bacterium]|jgi:UDP-glucuronate decarboxylase|nr:NAD-dependent epimerase/dehydratase family protein [Chitinophagales bacterium]HPN19044.1 NAD-dependent epimerase/dehydratase family protein [Chitinophagales bacterium]
MKTFLQYANRILVTGGAGNVGSALVERLIQDQNNFVIVVDNLFTGSLEKLPKNGNNWKFIKCDANIYDDIMPIFLSYSIDYVFHYAATVGVQRTLDNPVRVLNDIEGIKNILNLSKNTPVKRVFYSSSSEVYGEPVEFPQNEHTTPLNSKLPYAIVKNIGEAFLKSYKQEYNLNYTIFRFFNTYGPNQSQDFVIAKFIKLALKNEDITIYGDGSQSRTLCYIDDNIDATVNAFLSSDWENTTINIGNDNETSVLEIAHKIISMTNSSSKIVHLPALKDGDMTRRLPDITNMKTLLGNRPLVSLEEGISKILTKWS